MYQYLWDCFTSIRLDLSWVLCIWTLKQILHFKYQEIKYPKNGFPSSKLFYGSLGIFKLMNRFSWSDFLDSYKVLNSLFLFRLARFRLFEICGMLWIESKIFNGHVGEIGKCKKSQQKRRFQGIIKVCIRVYI